VQEQSGGGIFRGSSLSSSVVAAAAAATVFPWPKRVTAQFREQVLRVRRQYDGQGSPAKLSVAEAVDGVKRSPMSSTVTNSSVPFFYVDFGALFGTHGLRSSTITTTTTTLCAPGKG